MASTWFLPAWFSVISIELLIFPLQWCAHQFFSSRFSQYHISNIFQIFLIFHYLYKVSVTCEKTNIPGLLFEHSFTLVFSSSDLRGLISPWTSLILKTTATEMFILKDTHQEGNRTYSVKITEVYTNWKDYWSTCTVLLC